MAGTGLGHGGGGGRLALRRRTAVNLRQERNASSRSLLGQTWRTARFGTTSVSSLYKVATFADPFHQTLQPMGKWFAKKSATCWDTSWSMMISAPLSIIHSMSPTSFSPKLCSFFFFLNESSSPAPMFMMAMTPETSPCEAAGDAPVTFPWDAPAALPHPSPSDADAALARLAFRGAEVLACSSSSSAG